MNAFEAVLHSAYLVMKIPSKYEVITIFGSQEDARKAEGSWAPQCKQVNIVGEEEVKEKKEKITTERVEPGEAMKQVSLDPHVVD